MDPPASSADLYAQPAQRRLARPLELAQAAGVREQLRLLGALEPDSRVVDLGAGDGRLAIALARSGHRVTAVEPFRDVPDAPGLTLRRESVEQVELREHSFDAAVLWHVLEHLAEPLAVLERVRRWLVPGGRVLVGVPNLAGFQARIGGERWFHLDTQRHLVHFTPAGLTTLLEHAGYIGIRQRPVVADQALAGMWMTLLNRVTRQPDALRSFVRKEPTSRRDLAVTAVLAVPLVPASAILEVGAAATGRGGVLAVLGQAP